MGDIADDMLSDAIAQQYVLESLCEQESLEISSMSDDKWVSYMLDNYPEEYRYRHKNFPAYSILYKLHHMGWKPTDKQVYAINNAYMHDKYGCDYKI